MTEATSPTPFLIRCEILSDLWLNYKTDKEFAEFFAYNDLGLPLAYAIAEGVVEATPIATRFVEETFEMLVASLTIEDEGFENLDEMFTLAEENK
jgi:PDZ domain-containing secreted protein